MRAKNYGLAYKLANEEFIKVILTSSSCNDAMLKMGFTCIAGNARKTVKRRIAELAIDTSHWGSNTRNAHLAITTSHEQYFAKDTPHTGHHIRDRVLKYNLLPYVCASCGNTGEWLGKQLTLQIDHINGDHNDNRLENLRFLCPNCHAQTETFAGKNVKVK